eukprot:COSAG02_NODE_59503_length_274_cov_0.588571_1_plen_91_part_11
MRVLMQLDGVTEIAVLEQLLFCDVVLAIVSAPACNTTSPPSSPLSLPMSDPCPRNIKAVPCGEPPAVLLRDGRPIINSLLDPIDIEFAAGL